MSDWITDAIDQMMNDLYKSMYSGIDPNDLQGACPHVWDSATDSCKLCKKHWDAILWDAKPCCGGTPATYTGGKWHDRDCDTLKPPNTAGSIPYPQTQIDYRPAAPKKGLCTCGSAAVGSDRHSSWCDVK